jgi:hypothetical protein
MSEQDHKVAIITGAAQGIGAGLVAEYRRRGERRWVRQRLRRTGPRGGHAGTAGGSITSSAAMGSFRIRRPVAWPTKHPRIGVLPFNLQGVSYAKLAAVLSGEYGIGVRHGCFCAHPLMTHLLGIDDARSREIGANRRSGRPVTVPGAVRLSVWLGTTWFVEEVFEVADGHGFGEVRVEPSL